VEAEIGRAASEGVRGQWKPDGIGEIRAGLYNDDDFRCAGNVEAKLICAHTEARAAGLHAADFCLANSQAK